MLLQLMSLCVIGPTLIVCTVGLHLGLVLRFGLHLFVCLCGTDIDDCDPNPCENGGVCVDQVAGFLCNCTIHHSGDRCEI